jgi:hypothetical protein
VCGTQVRDQHPARHRHEAAQEVIPADDAGVMVTDRGRSYDAQAFDPVEQPKCLAHILRSFSAARMFKRLFLSMPQDRRFSISRTTRFAWAAWQSSGPATVSSLILAMFLRMTKAD